MAENSIVEVIATLIKEWLSLTKARQRDLLRLCNAKYQELQDTHEQFTRCLDELTDIVEHTKQGGPGANSNPLDEIEQLDRRRRDGRQMRMTRFEEARFYAEESFINDSRALKTVPDAVIAAVRATMMSYADYFRRDREYEHDLGHAIRHVGRYISLARDSASTDQQIIVLNHALGEVREAQARTELAWLRFSRDYYRAYAVFADNGVYLAEDRGSAAKPSSTR